VLHIIFLWSLNFSGKALLIYSHKCLLLILSNASLISETSALKEPQ
ncbi:unnamed protein product, partial [Musa textilis]